MSSRSVFERMHNRLFARLGEQAVLRGSVNCRVNIEYGVVVSYENGDDKFVQSEFAATVDVANIEKSAGAKPGDTLYVVDIDKTYRLDALAADNGFMQRFVLLPVNIL